MWKYPCVCVCGLHRVTFFLFKDASRRRDIKAVLLFLKINSL